MLDWLILLPLALTVLLNLPATSALRRIAAPLAALLAAAQAVMIAVAPAGWLSGDSVLHSLINLNLQLTDIGRLMLLCIGVAALAAACVAQAMLKNEGHQRANFISLLLVSMMGMNGTVLVSDLFSLYVFIEVTSVASFVLIAFDRQKKGLEGAFKYLILSAVATVLMLGAMALLLMISGTMEFAGIRTAMNASHQALLAKLALASFICGLLIKGGLVPFHWWVLGAYSASPSPTSVLLAGVVTKACGIYALIRLVGTPTSVLPSSPELNQVLMALGTASIIVGAVLALRQNDMKRLLSYSSISQIGYIVLGLGGGTALTIAGAIFHLFNHTVFKSLLFVNAASVERRSGTTDMGRLGGLGAHMPVSNLTSVIGLLSTAGIPPLSGFWSKLFIILGLWQAGHYGYAAVAILFSLVTLAYLLQLQRKVFFGKPSEAVRPSIGMSGWMAFPELLLAAMTLVAGLLVWKLQGSFLLPPLGF